MPCFPYHQPAVTIDVGLSQLNARLLSHTALRRLLMPSQSPFLPPAPAASPDFTFLIIHKAPSLTFGGLRHRTEPADPVVLLQAARTALFANKTLGFSYPAFPRSPSSSAPQLSEHQADHHQKGLVTLQISRTCYLVRNPVCLPQDSRSPKWHTTVGVETAMTATKCEI
jgi:hypothetical protein